VREMADRRVAAADPDGAAKRARRARAEKNVFHAKRPDTMGLLGANLPAEQAAACYEALDHDARGKRADGDQRSIAHIMCDTLVERLTGARRATDAYTIELQVVLTDEALLGTDTTTAELVGYGVLPVRPGHAAHRTDHDLDPPAAHRPDRRHPYPDGHQEAAVRRATTVVHRAPRPPLPQHLV
jgi:hypothetical protein